MAFWFKPSEGCRLVGSTQLNSPTCGGGVSISAKQFKYMAENIIYILYPKGINPEYSLEGLILKMKLQYFGHLMRTAN